MSEYWLYLRGVKKIDTKDKKEKYNAYCKTCVKNIVVEDRKEPCPTCNQPVKILGKKISIGIKGCPNTKI